MSDGLADRIIARLEANGVGREQAEKLAAEVIETLSADELAALESIDDSAAPESYTDAQMAALKKVFAVNAKYGFNALTGAPKT